jgi:hypothetical protein
MGARRSLFVSAALVLAGALADPACAQPATPPGPAVPIFTTPAAPSPPSKALPMGTLRQPANPSAAVAPPSPAAPPARADTPPPIGGGSLPLSNTPSNISSGNTTSPIAPPLPPPPLDDNAPPAAFLRAARAALLAGRTGEAQEALERAESRALDRAVRRSQADTPSAQPLVRQIAAARQSLADPDRQRSIALIDTALRNEDSGVK